MELAWTHTNTTRLQRKRMIKTPTKRSRKRNVDEWLQAQLEEDGDSSTGQR